MLGLINEIVSINLISKNVKWHKVGIPTYQRQKHQRQLIIL